jgi:uncharacterized membrane protein
VLVPWADNEIILSLIILKHDKFSLILRVRWNSLNAKLSDISFLLTVQKLLLFYYKCMSLLTLKGIRCHYWVDCQCICFPFVVPLFWHWMGEVHKHKSPVSMNIHTVAWVPLDLVFDTLCLKVVSIVSL